MGRRYGPFFAVYTAASVFGLAWRIQSALPKTRPLLSDDAFVSHGGLLSSLFQSSISTAFLLNILLNCFVLASLVTKAIFFGKLSIIEVQKLVERLINYVIFKVLFLALIARPDMMQIALWLGWFAVFGFLKVFQGLAKDRLERLNASPTATVFDHGRVFTVLVLVLIVDLLWIPVCISVFKNSGINTLLLLLFEPLSISFDTVQAMLVHGTQLYDTWYEHTTDVTTDCDQVQPTRRSAAAAAWEWRTMMIQNCSFIMDVVSLLLALGHCLHIWWLRGLAFKLVDGVLLLNLRTLLSSILKRIKGFLRVRTAMNTLQCALPDATQEELLAYEDDCAICKEPMARAKQLPCAHLFHLPCLRSWLDQGFAEAYSCPTCRRPLFMGSTSSFCRRQQLTGRNHTITSTDGHSGSVDLQMLDNLSQRSVSNSVMGPLMGQQWTIPSEHSSWSDTEGEFTWTDTFHRGISERGGPSTTGIRHDGPMQAVMQRFTGQRRSLSQNGATVTSWNWWPFTHRVPQVNSHLDDPAQGIAGTAHHNVQQHSANNSQMHAMVNTVREVLPHIPEEMIVQELQRTNSITAAVNNLL